MPDQPTHRPDRHAGEGVSLALDLVRAAAAMTVVLCHLGARLMSDGRFWPFAHLGSQAVDVFFVLSGYVIAASATRERGGLGGFLRARGLRLYSVGIPAILLTAICDRIGSAAAPDLYAQLAAFAPGHAPTWLQYAASSVFCHRLWQLTLPLGSNVPWWSLGFEPWYYLMFGLLVFIRGPGRLVAAGLAALVAGPAILLLAPLWAAGVLVSRRHAQGFAAALWVSPAAIMALVAYNAAFYLAGHSLIGVIPGVRPELLQDWLVGGLFALALLHLPAWESALSAALRPVTGMVRGAAGMSFSLYAIHFPVMMMTRSLLPLPPGWARDGLTLLAGVLAGVLLAALTERRYSAWRARQRSTA